MNILCPVDFSSTSVNACSWTARFLHQVGGGKIQLLNCINVVSRSAMFVKMDDVFKEQAEKDFEALLPQLKAVAPDIEFETKVVIRDPKTFLPPYAEHHNFDLIVNGTKGLTALKNMTVGSVTAYLMDHSSVPLLTVPESTEFGGVRKVIFGIDAEVRQAEAFQKVVKITRQAGAELVFVNTSEEITAPEEVETFTIPIDDFVASGFVIPQGESIPKALTRFCQEQKADILVMIHRRRNWFQRLFNDSMTKEQLFEINTPLLILPTAKQ